MSEVFTDLSEYLMERPNLTKLPVDKNYAKRYEVADDEIAWDHPNTPEYERIRDERYSFLLSHIKEDYAQGKYGTHPEVITPDLTEMFREQGLDIDEQGRPRHPGGKTGLGSRWGLWHFGGRDVVDMVITREKLSNELEIAVVRKPGKTKAALPGGFTKPHESFEEAALREVKEEAGLKVGKTPLNLLAKQVTVGSSRTTDHAWLFSTIFHVHLTGVEALQVTEVEDREEIAEAQWLKVDHDLLAPMSEHHRAPIVTVAKKLGYTAALSVRD